MTKTNTAIVSVLAVAAIGVLSYLIYLNYRAAPTPDGNQSQNPATSTVPASIAIYCSNNNCAAQQINFGAELSRDCFRNLSDCQTAQTAARINCQTDADCVPEQCCHAASCINSSYKTVCNVLCTQICSGPLDCGAGSCKCVNGKCGVATNTTGY